MTTSMLSWRSSWVTAPLPWRTARSAASLTMLASSAMITRYGMSGDFDMVALETVTNQYMGGDTSLICAPETSAKIDQMVVETVKAQHEKARNLLRANEDKLRELSRFLCEKER
mgnify:CR=1 FL=1